MHLCFDIESRTRIRTENANAFQNLILNFDPPQTATVKFTNRRPLFCVLIADVWLLALFISLELATSSFRDGLLSSIAQMSSQQYYYPQPQSYNSGYFEPNSVHFSQFSYGEATQQKPQNSYFTPAPIDGNIDGQFNFVDEPPLLEELGVNFGHILQKIWYSNYDLD
ncbi:hypothetical protein TcWFU_004089 [Taenia crassiceps]|uniref:Uncharacterized protein n=1 Tax=Taenia crassiceps TaxID=6207 RepID=A0ABR4QL61_9CEST